MVHIDLISQNQHYVYCDPGIFVPAKSVDEG